LLAVRIPDGDRTSPLRGVIVGGRRERLSREAAKDAKNTEKGEEREIMSHPFREFREFRGSRLRDGVPVPWTFGRRCAFAPLREEKKKGRGQVSRRGAEYAERTRRGYWSGEVCSL
jgi:hypothetical protein